MIGKCDAIHSGVFLSFVAVIIVGLTIGSTLGLMGYFGVPNGNLNNNLYFLLLGLGVDDAFVLSSEFMRHSREDGQGKSIAERIALTAKTGGISVLITSATDALAFLVGATTVLPALGWFCTYAGVSIVLCYTFQLTVFLPCLALNARRVEANRVDCCCCFHSKERSIEDPQGCCCGCCLPKAVFKGGHLSKGLAGFMRKVTTPVGQAVTFILFAALTGVGIWGSTMIYKDFKLEWFIPDSSYVNEFLGKCRRRVLFDTLESRKISFDSRKVQHKMRCLEDVFSSLLRFFNINSEYFATGTPITVTGCNEGVQTMF